MYKMSAFPFAPMMAPAQELIEQWIGLFPTAPLFGVEYRFAGMHGGPIETWMSWTYPMPARANHNRDVAGRPTKSPETVMRSDRPVTAPEATFAAAPESTAEAAPAESAPAVAAGAIENDDIKRIRGIGPKLADELESMGIISLGQIAAFTPGDLARVDAALTTIKGRCYRDDWVGQARALIA